MPGEFPPEVLEEAAAVVADPPVLERDETAVPFVTIDPPGSMDLDQAMALERDGDGYRVRYAIADVPDFVRPGGAIDVEARRRVETIYLPDGRSPLHPPQLSEGAASLLPDQVRPAIVWDLRLDAAAEVRDVQVYRAMVRSTQRLDYAGVQADIDAGTAPESIMLLREIGTKREALEIARGGASLPMPEQEVEATADGYDVKFRPPVPAEGWNAQISLMTGMVAANLMLEAKVGILRTMPTPDPATLEQFRRQAAALGVDWPQELSYGAFLATLDQADPVHLALIHEATSLFRGAGYTPVDGEAPDQVVHAAVAAPYAHVTAPLRRLVDRFGLAICVAISAGETVPDWARAALPELPELMSTGDRRASSVDRACTDAVEAAVLKSRVGQRFPAVVVARRDRKGNAEVVVQLTDPAVLATCPGDAAPGTRTDVTLVAADVMSRTITFELARDEGAAPTAGHAAD